MKPIYLQPLKHRMSCAVQYGNVLYLSGITCPGDDISVQTKGVLMELERRLQACGSSKSHLLRATIYLKDIGLFDDMNAIWDAWVDPTALPARACVQAELARKELLVEIAVDAVVAE